MSGKLIHLINAALLSGMLVFGVSVYETLPAEIPRHFGFGGIADGWWTTNWLSWMIHFLIGLAVTLILYGTAWIVRRHSGSINMPNQKRFDDLSDGGKKAVAGIVEQFLFWTAAGVILITFASQTGVWSVATGRTETLPSYFHVVLLSVVAGIIVGAVYMARVSRREVDRLHESENDG